MLAALAAALSLASSPVIEVPYLPQTDALCGGAAAAMVFRYWGDVHADPQQFASLIERHGNGAVGIADDALVSAIRSRGWLTEPLAGSAGTDDAFDALRSRLAARQPVIVLLADRGNQYHYVVVTGATDEAVLIHDPSWGPSRAIALKRFRTLWHASRNWGIVVLPSQQTTTPKPTQVASGPADAVSSGDGGAARPPDPCESSVADAVREVRQRGVEHADEILGALRSRCAESPAFLRELAGVRFAQKRWRDSSLLARRVLAREPRDEYASELLGASLFMQEDPAGALRAWNGIRQPRLDLVRISGLTRSRYQTIVEAIGLRSGTLLTPDAYVRAQHRIEELPDRTSSRLSLRPGEDGFASVDVALTERSGMPRGYADWVAGGLRAAVEREAAVTLPGFTGEGETWSAGWRWWNNRPRVAFGFAAPRVAGWPGVWHLDAFWEAETYSVDARLKSPAPSESMPVDSARESRIHGGLTVSDWIRPRLRYSISGGLDSWNTGRRAASIGGSLERRWLDDHLSVVGEATKWFPAVSANAGFSTVGVRARAQSTSASGTWDYDMTVGMTRVSDLAPLAIWTGAGEGRARPGLLRAHPLLDEGVIDASDRSTFGRTLQYASAEARRWLPGPAFVRIGLAAFVDVARASRLASGLDGVAQTDIGTGVRVRVPGAHGVLRVDVAHGIRDGANAFTAGWIF